MAKTATVSSKGQITLPKDLREKHHLIEGEKVLVLDGEDGVVIRHARKSLRGLLKGKIDGDGMERDLRKLRREWRL
ncbi:MAG: AbrB/MazE/SpoVT family DNA-binding domain-containing protein [Euryarchaeota archaeon]|nr:AbrB/MazE/SpoVT family DNA-binding domain-containing protein [Euryarchaeota archaeon]MDE1837639.1 AbrB/MazE/SpoVT family DNA-binding domain-containing protein [Euryarchaeota archaeon]MDE2045930.1 AbrB/MazE/SpoVT family DNA-binding domain-containing protein [Thermoplasmata archaeon]